MNKREKLYEDLLNHTFFKDIADRAKVAADAIDRIENHLFKIEQHLRKEREEKEEKDKQE